MKVIILNSYSSKGGASRAAARLHEALRIIDVDCEFFSVYSSSPTFYKRFLYYARVLYDRLPGFFYAKKKVMFSRGGISNNNLVKYINNSDADIVHFHWLNAGAISLSDIAKIEKKIVWSLHDMWLFTGGCHYDQDCGAYVRQCGSCPILRSTKDNDLSRTVWQKKYDQFYSLDNFLVVGLSRWMVNRAQSSSLFENKCVVNLPNPIDTRKFQPLDKYDARRNLGLPNDKILVLFGAMSYQDDSRKGYKELVEALANLTEHNIELVTFGTGENDDALCFPVTYLGDISDDEKLILAYNAADMLVSPSIQENLSNVIMESLSCGTPVVCFDIGGNSDMVVHKKTGYLARPYQPIDLANGIDWLVNKNNLMKCSEMAREKVVDEFDYSVVGPKYVDLYVNFL